MSRIWFLVLLLTLSGCSWSWFHRGNIKQIQSTEASRVILVFSEKMRYERHLELDDSVICYDDTINKIRLDYSSTDILTLCEARGLLVDLVEEFLDRINSNGILYPDLVKHPLTASNLEIYIKFKSFYDRYVDLQNVGLITLCGGIASYIAADTLDPMVECWHHRSEYYYQSRNFTQFMREGKALYGEGGELSKHPAKKKENEHAATAQPL